MRARPEKKNGVRLSPHFCPHISVMLARIAKKTGLKPSDL